MRRRPQPKRAPAVQSYRPLDVQAGLTGLVLSGGGARAAYQVGALRAMEPYLRGSAAPISIIVGSSIGAINGILLAACLRDGMSSALSTIEQIWMERNFRNTFNGSPSRAFMRAVRVAVMQYLAPGPHASSASIFDPTPLMDRVDLEIERHGGLTPEQRAPQLRSVAVMTTVEGAQRKPLLFVSSHERVSQQVMFGASFEVCYVDTLSAKHGFASAALPAVLPPVELDTEHGKVRLVDGGISQNVPVDPAVRLGADRVIVVDISGRDWWLRRYGEAGDTRPTWEVPANTETFCLRPPDTFVVRCQQPLGPLLRQAVSGSTRRFISAVGPTWPVFSLLKNKLGEDVAYEVMSYVALDTDYIQGLIERGYSETRQLLRNRTAITFDHDQTVSEKLGLSVA